MLSYPGNQVVSRNGMVTLNVYMKLKQIINLGKIKPKAAKLVCTCDTRLKTKVDN